MRSSRALRSFYAVPRIPLRSSQRWATQRSYCSSCDESRDQPKRTLPKTSKDLRTPPADHRQLGIDQDLFTTSIYSPGSPLFLPNGTKIFNKLTAFLRAQYDRFGFEEVITPTIYKKSLWEKSGHWENYAEDMYSVTGRGATGQGENRQVGEDEEYGLKPMNCPGHCLLFASKKRSYNDLPIRFADFSPLHRNEVSGALSGLTRVRRFHQDDGHIFCRPAQIREEISKTLQFIKTSYEILRLGSYRLTLSTRPETHYIGSLGEWDNAEKALKESLEASGEAWTINEGDGAFYGPKIDIILKDSDGKEHQTATIQLDFQLPKRFELEYIAPAPELEAKGQTTEDATQNDVQGPVTPVLIHRAVLGSVERMMALLIEHYNGRWPFWLQPRQVLLVPLNDTKPILQYTHKLKQTLHGALDTVDPLSPVPSLPTPISMSNKLSVDIDDSPKPLGKRISTAKRKGYSVIVVVGRESLESDKITCDFTGVVDPEEKLLSHSSLQDYVLRESRDRGGHALPQTSGEGSEPRVEKLQAGELRQVKLAPAELRRFLLGLQDAYF